MKTLIAGPWVGEFGWELFAWSGYVRALSRKFEKTIIISRPGNEILYADFANEFYSFTPKAGPADSFFMHNLDTKQALKWAITQNKIKLNEGTTIFLPRRIGFPPHTHFEQYVILGNHMVKPEYIKYGNPSNENYDFVFHIRNRDLRKEDNWELNKWEVLKNLLGGRIACIGTKEESICIPGTEDLRGKELSKTISVLSSSKCAFGPSSGPMHLASLCGTPHVVWSLDANKARYEENWNPLKTRVLFDSSHDWHPTPEYIYKRFLEWS